MAEATRKVNAAARYCENLTKRAWRRRIAKWRIAKWRERSTSVRRSPTIRYSLLTIRELHLTDRSARGFQRSLSTRGAAAAEFKRLLGAAVVHSAANRASMTTGNRTYSLPRWRVTRWLADCGPGVPDDIRHELIGNLFGGLPIFAGGVINTLVVAGAIAFRNPSIAFLSWFGLEVVVCSIRLGVLLVARRSASRRRQTPTDLYLLLAVAWSVSVGYGGFVSLTSGDWVAATLACLSSAAMVGGICFRNFSAPRLASVMVLNSMGACMLGALLSGQPLLYVVVLQAPLYVGSMGAAAFTLNKMLVATMRAERENSHRAKHDALTGLSNRHGLIEAAKARLLAAPGQCRPLALLFLDLDNFKTVNDTFGHAFGDRLLQSVAERLKGELATVDVAARIGGDEFVVLIDAPTRGQAIATGERLIAAVARSYVLGEGIVAEVGVSIGIAVAPEHGNDAESLLAVADAALYQAKSGGKGHVCMATPMTNLAALRRLKAGMVGSVVSGNSAAA
jgi:diguanylate cyclase (GGDEF)-like protein